PTTATWLSPAAGPWLDVNTSPSTRAQNANRRRSRRARPAVHHRSHDAPRAGGPAAGGRAITVIEPWAAPTRRPQSRSPATAAVARHMRGRSKAMWMRLDTLRAVRIALASRRLLEHEVVDEVGRQIARGGDRQADLLCAQRPIEDLDLVDLAA